MRCTCCNKNLNDFESTLKHGITGNYLDTCRKCLKGLGIPVQENNHEPDAMSPDEIEELDIYLDFNNDDEEVSL